MKQRQLFWFRGQYLLGRLAVFSAAPFIVLLIKLIGYRINNLKEIRAQINALFERHPGPWLICANHLTLIDSAIIAYAMFPFYRYMLDYRLMPWNVPEKTNFHRNVFAAAVCYLLKCIPVVRGGSRESVRVSLAKCARVFEKGENILIFPEGTRARDGRVNPARFSYGPGRLVAGHPDCGVLCVYLRGKRQKSCSRIPVPGETFFMSAETCALRIKERGLKAQREYSRQIIEKLAEMEAGWFAAYGK